MPARLHLADHLGHDELFARYQAAQRPLARSHWQVLWRVRQNFRTEDISDAIGYSPTWIRNLVGCYNDGGPEAMGDQWRHHSGTNALLSTEDEAALEAALQEDPSEGDAGTGPLVARWMSERVGQEVSRVRGGEALRRRGYTPQRPRPAHDDADPQAQAAFQSGTPRDTRLRAEGTSRGRGAAVGGR